MDTPVTQIDRRFSDPDAVATRWDEVRRALEAAQLFWISTVRADGRPHVTPLVAVWLDGAIHFTTGPAEQKAINLRGNPHVILTTGCNHWDAGLDVVVEGEAVQVTDDDVLQRLAKAWAARWDGRFPVPQRRLSPPRWRCGLGILGKARQSPGLRQGQLQPDTSPVLAPAGACSQADSD